MTKIKTGMDLIREAGRERPRCCRAADQCDELASLHLVASLGRHVRIGAVRDKNERQTKCRAHAAGITSQCRIA